MFYLLNRKTSWRVYYWYPYYFIMAIQRQHAIIPSIFTHYIQFGVIMMLHENTFGYNYTSVCSVCSIIDGKNVTEGIFVSGYRCSVCVYYMFTSNILHTNVKKNQFNGSIIRSCNLFIPTQWLKKIYEINSTLVPGDDHQTAVIHVESSNEYIDVSHERKISREQV